MMMSRSLRNRCLLPTLELLEGRDCPSVSATFAFQTLLVRGDAADNEITITDDGQGNVSATIDGTTVEGKNVRNIIVLAGDGDDAVTYTASGSLEGSRRLGIHLGKGDDSFTLEGSQGITSGTLAVAVLGHQGADTMEVTLGSIEEGARALLTLHGANGDDTATTTFTGDLNGKLAFGLHGGTGNDTLTGDVTVNEGSTGKLAALVQGGSGGDTLTLNINDSSAIDGETGLDFFRALVVGGSGNNTVDSTDNVTVVNR